MSRKVDIKLCSMCKLPLCEHGLCINSQCSNHNACICELLYDYQSSEVWQYEKRTGQTYPYEEQREKFVRKGMK